MLEGLRTSYPPGEIEMHRSEAVGRTRRPADRQHTPKPVGIQCSSQVWENLRSLHGRAHPAHAPRGPAAVPRCHQIIWKIRQIRLRIGLARAPAEKILRAADRGNICGQAMVDVFQQVAKSLKHPRAGVPVARARSAGDG